MRNMLTGVNPARAGEDSYEKSEAIMIPPKGIGPVSYTHLFPGKLKMMEKKRPQNFLLTGMSDLSGWKPEWRDEVFVKIRENPQHQFLFLTKRPDLLDFDTDPVSYTHLNKKAGYQPHDLRS